MRRNRFADRVIRGLALALLPALLAGVTCSRQASRQGWPAGAFIVADTRSLDRLLGQLTRLSGTPLARRAASLRSRLPDCAQVAATSPGLADAWNALGCADVSADPDFDEVLRARGDRPIVLGAPLGAEHWVATLSIAPGGELDAELRMPASPEGLAALAMPGGAPGDAKLNDADSLIHARLRPQGGLDLARLVSSGSQGDAMFKLKSGLFSGVVLDGTWEAAVYFPDEGHSMPRAALALGFSHREAAVSAMEEFVANLQQSWPVQRSHFQIAKQQGACLLDLRLMPDLAPCYVATDSQLVVGWNPSSIRHALASAGGDVAVPDEGGAVVHLSRFGRADRILTRALGLEVDEESLEALEFPWEQLIATGRPQGEGFQISLRLHSEDGT